MVLSWEKKKGMANSLCQISSPLVCSLLQNVGIASVLSQWGRSWVLWFFLGKINLGKDHPLGQVFCHLDCPSLRNLGITSALILLGS